MPKRHLNKSGKVQVIPMEQVSTSKSRNPHISKRQMVIFAIVALAVLVAVVIAVLVQNGLISFNGLPFAPSALEQCRSTFNNDSTYAVTESTLFSYGSPHRDNFAIIQPSWSGTLTVSGCIEHDGSIYVIGFAHEANTGYSYAAVYKNTVSTTPTH